MASRASALFADAFFAALRVRRGHVQSAEAFQRVVRRSSSSSTSNPTPTYPFPAPPPPSYADDGRPKHESAPAESSGKPQRASVPAQEEASDYEKRLDPQEPRLVDVVDNLLVDFTDPLPSEPLLVGRQRTASRGYFSIVPPAPDGDDIKVGVRLLDQLRHRAAEMEEKILNPPTPDSLDALDNVMAEEQRKIDELKEKIIKEHQAVETPGVVKLGEQPMPVAHETDGFAAEQFWTTDDLSPKHTDRSASTPSTRRTRKSSRTHSSTPTELPGRQWTDEPVSVPENSTAMRTGIIDSKNAPGLKDVNPGFAQPPIAKIMHGLDRVLFNPGVHWLRDPHSGVYNFDPYLETVPEVRDFDFDRLHPYVRASEDNALHRLAMEHGKQYAGSSSSLTGVLAHIYRLISGDKPVNVSMLSWEWMKEPRTFTLSQCAPVSVVLKPRDGVWLVDGASSSPEDDEKHILLWMGTMLEKFFTRTPAAFQQLQRGTPRPDTPQQREAYRFSASNRFLMRGQLDCVDKRLPGTGVFDLKTRASMLVRLDRWNMEDFAGYEILKQTGLYESFEREVYDLVRSAFLKYTMQARIGNMDGCLVAYHNTVRMMGFEYFSVGAMEERLYGSAAAGDKVFRQCVRLLEEILDVVTSMVPEHRVKLLVDKIEGLDRLDVYIDQGPRKPIILLHVDAKPLFNDIVVDKAKAIMSARHDWSLKYTIMRSTLEPATIQQFFEGVEARQEYGFPIGPGKTRRQMQALYKGFSVLPDGHTMPSSGSTDSDTAEDSQTAGMIRFYPATSKIKELRALARRGHIRILADQKRQGNKRRIVWRPDPDATSDSYPASNRRRSRTASKLRRLKREKVESE